MSVATLPHPPYGPNLAPLDFFFFPRVKRTLKATLYGMLEVVKAATKASLKEVAVDNFQGTFNDWVKRWQCFIKTGRILRKVLKRL